MTFRDMITQEAANFSRKAIAFARGRQIIQGDYYYLDYDHSATTVTNQRTSETHLAAYDGESTRIWYRNTVGQVHHNRLEDKLIRPTSLASS